MNARVVIGELCLFSPSAVNLLMEKRKEMKEKEMKLGKAQGKAVIPVDIETFYKLEARVQLLEEQMKKVAREAHQAHVWTAKIGKR